MYSLLVHLHSVGRWFVLLLLLIAIFRSLTAGRRPFTRADMRTGSWLVIFTDLMLLLGLSLWLFGPKGLKMIQQMGMSEVMKDKATEGYNRFFAIEHITMMVIAIILIHIGKAQGKKAISDKAKHTRTFVFYLIALLIILISIPWPFREMFKLQGWY